MNAQIFGPYDDGDWATLLAFKRSSEWYESRKSEGDYDSFKDQHKDEKRLYLHLIKSKFTEH